jgi:hypothetical protein
MPAVTAIDLGALTATIRGDATTRVATMIATTLTNLEEDGRGLNEIQTAKLMENAVYFFDGFEPRPFLQGYA